MMTDNQQIPLTKAQALSLLKLSHSNKYWDVMCKEYGECCENCPHWSAVYQEDIEALEDPEYENFELWIHSPKHCQGAESPSVPKLKLSIPPVNRPVVGAHPAASLTNYRVDWKEYHSYGIEAESSEKAIEKIEELREDLEWQNTHQSTDDFEAEELVEKLASAPVESDAPVRFTLFLD